MKDNVEAIDSISFGQWGDMNLALISRESACHSQCHQHTISDHACNAGHVLYEMALGRELTTPSIENIQQLAEYCPADIIEVCAHLCVTCLSCSPHGLITPDLNLCANACQCPCGHWLCFACVVRRFLFSSFSIQTTRFQQSLRSVLPQSSIRVV